MDPLAVPPAEAGRLLGGVPERTVWTLIGTGQLKSLKVGKRRLVRVVDIEAYLERQALLAVAPVGPTAHRGACTARPSTRPAGDGAVIPFPELEDGGSQTTAAPSAAKHRAATKKASQRSRR